MTNGVGGEEKGPINRPLKAIMILETGWMDGVAF